MIQKIKKFVTAISFLALLLSFSAPALALRDVGAGNNGGTGPSTTGTTGGSGSNIPDNCNRSGITDKNACANCNGTSPAADCVCHPEYQIGGEGLTPSQHTNCEACNNKSNAETSGQACLAKNPIVIDINNVVNVLAGLVAVVSVIMIIIGGVRYSIAGNNSNQIAAARKHIINAVIALIAFFLLWAILQWLIPGGVFNS